MHSPLEAQASAVTLCGAQAEGQAFDTPEELLKAVDLYNLTQRTFRDELLVRRLPILPQKHCNLAL